MLSRIMLSPKMLARHAPVLSLLLATALWGCGGNRTVEVNPNEFPTNYRSALTAYLVTELTTTAEFRGAMVTEPALKPVGSDQRYVSCLRLNRPLLPEKAVIYFGGRINQYLDATPELCGGAVYQPFTELAQMQPQRH